MRYFQKSPNFQKSPSDGRSPHPAPFNLRFEVAWFAQIVFFHTVYDKIKLKKISYASF